MISRHRAAMVCALAIGLALRVECASPPAPSADPATILFAQAAALAASNDFQTARATLGKMSGLPGASPAHRSLAQLLIAHFHAVQGDKEAAIRAYESVARENAAPAHHREEARREMALMRNEPPSTAKPRELPPTQPSREFHVAANGSDSNAGTATSPFATLERARDAIRALKKDGPLPKGGVAVIAHGGSYPVTRTFQLSADDSGTEDSPVIYRAAGDGAPVFTGGVTLRGFSVVTDRAILDRLPEEARGKVRKVNLREPGATPLWPLQLGGFASGRGFKTHPVMELFFNDQPMQLARWPNDGFITIANISTNDGLRVHGLAGSKTGTFEYDSDRPLRWKDEKDVRLYGYWFWDWADSYEQVASIDTVKRVMTLAPPYHTYGYRKGQRFHALNLLSEIDMPGEWYLDRDNGTLYLWPPSDPGEAKVELSAAPFTFLEAREASHVRFESLTWELGSADAITINGGEDVTLAGCAVRKFAGNGVTINGGKNNGVLSTDIESLGRGGIRVSGGDRKTLAACSNFVENCHIHDLSRIDHTYTPAVGASGVGLRIARNLMHHIRSSAINLGGNDHLVELNEAGHVVQESDDQGAVDMFGNPTYRGVVYRWNYFHHIGPWKKARTEPDLGQAGIRLDDAISGILVYGNIFRHAATGKHGFGGVQIHGGHENVIDNNLFIDCVQGVSFSPWNENRWLEHAKPFIESKEIDLALYTNRYPAMATWKANANVNHLWRNQFVNCAQTLRNNRAALLAANQESPNAARLDAALTRFPATTNITVSSAIPFAEIGLYPDRFRPQLPSRLINELRGDN